MNKRPDPKPKKRLVTPEEKAVWKKHTEQDEKLRPEEVTETDILECVIEIPDLRPISVAPEEKVTKARKSASVPLKPLQKSDLHSMDGRTAERFRKGKLPIDARLDLHGHTRESAYIRLLAFIHESYQKGARCTLIITGRGLFQKDKPASERGVLKAALKGWLNDPSIRPFILAFEQAQIKDGGEGAYYVLLKKRR